MSKPSHSILRVISRKHGTFQVKIDEDDWERVSRHTWCVRVDKNGRFYFLASVRKPDGKRTSIYLHRFLMPHCPEDVDHAKHDYTDLRKFALRCASRSENSRNMRKTHGSSRFKGVSRHKRLGKWQAQIKHNKKVHHLGYCSDSPEGLIVCAKRYDAAARELFGEFAKTNFYLEAA
jgi:hypothetical protein